MSSAANDHLAERVAEGKSCAVVRFAIMGEFDPGVSPDWALSHLSSCRECRAWMRGADPLPDNGRLMPATPKENPPISQPHGAPSPGHGDLAKVGGCGSLHATAPDEDVHPASAEQAETALASPSTEEIARTALAACFHSRGYIRAPDLTRRQEIQQAYHRGWEVRLVVDTDAELEQIRRQLYQAGFNPGTPFRKRGSIVQPIYGREAVVRFRELTQTTRCEL